MTMIPEIYVDKEIMPLLLKANCPLRRVIKQDFRPVYYTKDFNDEGWQDCDAYYIPTQAQVMKWLREVHNLHICIFIGEDYSTDADGNTVDKWQFWTYHITNIWGDVVYDAYDKFDCTEYKSYEEACEAAIKYCLTNLI